ncbi:MAG: branched-chain amino acid transport system permease protein [Actinomycetota bacterium]|jgi:branched-chain amino acid transport system permease protein|nr:branched-chain amino acid transport system permease protein [Actinomycetota bacterium]
MILSAPVAQVTSFGLAAGAVFGLLALGLVLIYRTTGIMNFAHWAIGLMSAVTYALLTAHGAPPWVGIALSIPFAIALGVLAYRLVFRRISRSNQVIVILVSLGIAQLYSSLATMVLGFQEFTPLEPWLPVRDLTIGSITVRTTEIITVAIAIGVAFGFLVWFRVSRTGRALRAVAQNREAAMLAGIDDIRYSSLAWGIGSGLAALAVLLVMPHVGGERGGLITTFDTTPLGTLLIPAFGAALLGGLVHLPMALAGGFLFGLTRELLVLAPAPWNEMRGTAAAVLIVFLLLLRTERFFATKQELEALEA